MITPTSGSQGLPESSDQTLKSFSETLDLVGRLHQGIATFDAQNTELLKKKIEYLCNLYQQNQSVIIKDLALNLLSNIHQVMKNPSNTENVTNISTLNALFPPDITGQLSEKKGPLSKDLPTFLHQSLLLENFTLSRSAKDYVLFLLSEEKSDIDILENISRIEEITLEAYGQTETLAKSDELSDDLTTRLGAPLMQKISTLLTPDVFADVMQACITYFISTYKHSIDDTYTAVSIPPNMPPEPSVLESHFPTLSKIAANLFGSTSPDKESDDILVSRGVIPRNNIITKSENTLTLESQSVFRVSPPPQNSADIEKGIYLAAKIQIEIPLTELEIPIQEETNSNVKASYLVSKPFKTIEEAQEFLPLMETHQELLLNDFTPMTTPKAETLSILFQDPKKKSDIPPQLIADLNRMAPIVYKQSNGFTETLDNPTDENLKKIQIGKLSSLLGQDLNGTPHEELGKKYLSKIGELLTQTAWPNLIHTINNYPMDQIEPEFFIRETGTRSSNAADENVEFILNATNPKVFIHQFDNEILIENNCLFNFDYPLNPKRQFAAVKVAIKLPLDLKPCDIQAQYLVSHICNSSEEALAMFPFMSITFDDSPVTLSEETSAPEIPKQRAKEPGSGFTLSNPNAGQYIRDRAAALKADQQAIAEKAKKKLPDK
ncbi:MAG: hypothetical protein JSS09_01050 [Verrucomicrobia bacterium]|nr:hypothetical protein [Verrucomicrobiota bacterium]